MRIQVILDSEFERLELALRNAPAREAAAVGLLLYCGLRCHEVCDLTWKDVFSGGYLRPAVQVRTSHEPLDCPRLVDIPAKLEQLLKRYLAEVSVRVPEEAPNSPLFLTIRGKGRWHNRTLQRVCDGVTFAALGKFYSPRTLRHTYATRLMRHANIRVVQALLGHKSLQSTQIYTHPSSDDCSQAVSRAFK